MDTGRRHDDRPELLPADGDRPVRLTQSTGILQCRKLHSRVHRQVCRGLNSPENTSAGVPARRATRLAQLKLKQLGPKSGKLVLLVRHHSVKTLELCIPSISCRFVPLCHLLLQETDLTGDGISLSTNLLLHGWKLGLQACDLAPHSIHRLTELTLSILHTLGDVCQLRDRGRDS